jgi:hypothetical protein
MGSTTSKTGRDSTPHIDHEILRLGRELGSKDAQGHTCEQCNSFTRMKPFRRPTKRWDFSWQADFFELETTEKGVHDLAASGCNFWAMIRDQLAYIGLVQEAVAKPEPNKVSFNRDKDNIDFRSDEFYTDLAESLGGHREEEFWRLHHQRGVVWSVKPFEFMVPIKADSVLICMGYTSYTQYTLMTDYSTITVDVGFIVPEKPARIISHPGRTRAVDGPCNLISSTRFLALKLPGMYSSLWYLVRGYAETINWRRSCWCHEKTLRWPDQLDARRPIHDGADQAMVEEVRGRTWLWNQPSAEPNAVHGSRRV